MSLEVKGTLQELRPIQTGQSARGEWKKQELIIETKEQYPKKICLIAWGDKVDEVGRIPVGTDITAGINIESREYNGRWYTDVKIWRVQVDDGGFNQETPPQYQNVESNEGTSFDDASEMDDLPF